MPPLRYMQNALLNADAGLTRTLSPFAGLLINSVMISMSIDYITSNTGTRNQE